MERRSAYAAVFGWVIFAWPSYSVAQQTTSDVRLLMNNIHQNMSTCVSYFQIVSRCLAPNPKHNKTAAAYTKASEALLYKTFLLGQKLKISNDAAQARLSMSGRDMMQLIKNDCINISSLLSRYSDKCVAVANNPLKPLTDAVPMK